MNDYYFTIDQEKTNRDFCRDVAIILDSKFTKENLQTTVETDEKEVVENEILNPRLDDSDLVTIADFIISWFGRKCECLAKVHYDKLPTLIQTYLHYVPTVLTSIWRHLLLLDETSTNQEVINTRAHLLKKFQLFSFATIKCFMIHFTLYQVWKLRNLDLEEEEALYVKSEPGIPTHTLLLRNIYRFCRIARGLEMVATFFRDENELSRLPFLIAKELCSIVLCVRSHIVKCYLVEVVACLRPLVYRYLKQLPDTVIKDNKYFIEQIINSVVDPLEKGPSFDIDVLSLALKYICSSVLILKLEGLASLNQQLFLFLDWKTKGFLGENEDVLAKQYTNWIVENEIVERVLGRSGQGSFHPEVLKVSLVLLQFLATNGSLTTEHVDALWEDTKDKHSSRHVFLQLYELSKHIEEDLVDHLLGKLTDLPIEEHSFGSLHLCHLLTRAHWSKIQDVCTYDKTRMGLGRLVGVPENLEVILNNSERSSSSSVASTEVHIAEDNNAADQDLDIETIGMDTGSEEHIMINFTPQARTPPISDDPPPLIPLPQAKFAVNLPDDKLVPMERQSSDTTQSYSLEQDFNLTNLDPEDSTDCPIFSMAKHLTSTADTSADAISKPVKSLIQHLNTKGNSLLWDLLQDENINKLHVELREFAQRLLADLIKHIKSSEVVQHFMRACLLNVSQDKSVIFSLNLLLSLLSSPPSIFSGNYCAFSWAENELNMMEVFFQNWRRFIHKIEESEDLGNTYSTPKQLEARLDFLSTLVSHSFLAKAFTLTSEFVEEIWESLVVNSKLQPILKNKGFTWFDLQVTSMPQKIISYLVQNKVSDLDPHNIPLAGFSLVRHLFPYTNPDLSCTANPCLEMVWNIAMHHCDNQISQSAIEFLNTSYFSRGECSLSYEESFLRRSIKFLAEGLETLDTTNKGTICPPIGLEAVQKRESDVNIAYTLVRKALELLLSHLSLFQERFSFHLRIWSLQGRPLEKHCEEKFPGLPGKLALNPPTITTNRGDSIKIILVYKGYSDSYKTTLELCSYTLIAELRAEAVFYLIKAGKVKSNLFSPEQSFSSSLPPLKLTSDGQLLHYESDTKTLKELDIKDNSIIQASHTSVPSSIPGIPVSPSHLPAPKRKSIPHNILVELDAIQFLLRLATVLQQINGEILCTTVWRLLGMLPTSPKEVVRATCAISQETRDWELFFGNLANEQNLFKQLYSLQAIQTVLLRATEDKSISPAVRRAGLTICIARLSTHMEFCLSSNSCSESSQSLDSLDKENISPSRDGSIEGWTCWYQAVLCYWMEIVCLLSLHRVMQQDNSTGSDSDDLIEVSQDLLKCNTVKKIVVPNFELQMPKVAIEILQDNNVNILSLLCRALELGSVANKDCAIILSQRAWSMVMCWCQANNYALMDLLMRKDFSSLIEKILLYCQHELVRKLARRNFKQLYTEFNDPNISLTVLDHLLQCSIDNDVLLELSRVPPMIRSAITDPTLLSRPSEQLLKQSEECFICIHELIMFIQSSKKHKKNWRTSECYEHACYERLITRAPYEMIELIADKHFTRDTMDTPDIFLKGLLQTLTALTKLSADYTSSDQAKRLVERVLANLFPFKTYNLTNETQSPLPIYRNPETRLNAIDLLEAMVYQNPKLFPLVAAVLKQNHPVMSGIPWEYRPKDDLRDISGGYCGISNLGATCYMASTLQQLYMIPSLRNAILSQDLREVTPRHTYMFRELQRVFLHLWQSRRSIFNPDKFCREYIFDQQQLNPHEQRDMNEFFTDLLSKLEDTSFLLKKTVKGLFGGVIANVVMSNECSHVSRNCEDFYSVRAKVADMPDLQASLQELTQTDVLDGDNKYTCSQCGVSVRAEKRACFAQLPSLLCINTMRYTFNISTSINEKVNTHFPFPLVLDMKSFIESSNVSITDSCPTIDQDMDSIDPDLDCTKYLLVGVVVHTGTAEGGHYYTILQERDATSNPSGKWYMFNDQLVTEFDPDHIGQECFGGEIPNSVIDQHTRRIFPGLLERNNSAYMLFYQRKDFRSEDTPINPLEIARSVLLENNKFLREVYTFDSHYLQAVWKMCRHCKQDTQQLQVNAVKVATQVLLTTIIHSKERPNIRKCFDWLGAQYKEYPELCQSFLEYLCLADEHNWVLEMFYHCPIKPTRDLFVNLLFTVLQSIKKNYKLTFYSGFPKIFPEGDSYNATISEPSSSNRVSVACLIKSVVDLIGIPELLPTSNDFSPYFDFLYDFASLGQDECKLLTMYQVISKIDTFYSRATRQPHNPSLTFEEGILSLVYDDSNYHPDSLARFIYTLMNNLLSDKLFSKEDFSSLILKPGYPLITQLACSQANRQITCQIYFGIWDENSSLCSPMIDALFAALSRESRQKCGNIFQLLNIMVMIRIQEEFRSRILSSLLDNIRQVSTTASLPYIIDFLTMVMLSDASIYEWVMKQKGEWLAAWLIENEDINVRGKTTVMIYNLVPCQVFREYSKVPRKEPIKGIAASISQPGREFLYELIDDLLKLLPLACETSARCETSDGLVQYFQVLEKCSVGESECELLGKYFDEFWKLYHPRIATASVNCHEDKSALFSYFLHTCLICPSNLQCLIDHPTAPKDLSVIYILANNEKNEVVKYNNIFLEKYYTVMRLACEKSNSICRDISTQGNTFWALQNILPYYNLTPNAVEELYKMMNIIAKLPSTGSFRRKAITNCIERVLPSNPKTLRKVLKSLIRSEEDAMRAFSSGGLVKLSDAYLSLFSTLNETTSSHMITTIMTELDDILSIIELILKTVCEFCLRGTCLKEQLSFWKDNRNQFTETITHTLNSYVCTCHRQLALQILDITIKLYPYDVANLLLPFLSKKHSEFYKLPNQHLYLVGPYFPRIRPNQDTPMPNPDPKAIQQFNMFINDTQISADFGVDHLYDQALIEFYKPYYEILLSICEIALTHSLFPREMVRLVCLTAREGLRLRFDVLPKFILSIKNLPQQGEARIIDSFYESAYFIELIRTMLFSYNCVLRNEFLHKFCFIFYPKVKKNFSSECWSSFFQTTNEEFSKLQSDPNTHINSMKTLELYLKNNSVESIPSELFDTLSLYFTKHLKEEIVLCLPSQEKDQMDMLQSPQTSSILSQSPETPETEEQKVRERKRHTSQLSELSTPKRTKIDESAHLSKESDNNQQTITSPTQSSKTQTTKESNTAIEMLKLIQDLLMN
ncbi:Ubiquitin carboxyl-terminal hydrolase 34-like [Oopsacas minuta]|uniref:Ubiquitin carboxyl-terminal hydrolase 34-like n=1 Tax=Oopsacas minuta TaxID=111878 RepID=A0AAV7JX74_9METZ|nr:Ubiquitin carboxyl-terminal hydrolase 34-like [Oopsacas minuta]